MNDSTIATALIAAGSALLGSGIAAIATYQAARLGLTGKQRLKMLRSLRKDLLTFHAIEDEYLRSLDDRPIADHESRRKLDVRNRVFARTGWKLSPNSEPARLKRALESSRHDTD